ncbi:MAG: N-acetylmuramoyl-L-alanine amidase [Clostridia bacterium]|nr:N-acetylmuramoyl-L-alanine amidase [Clostridia bacterium]MBQ4575414.1 N-acetylmuramoyl-L-alanine amidase [Clostridia bacterium]
MVKSGLKQTLYFIIFSIFLAFFALLLIFFSHLLSECTGETPAVGDEIEASPLCVILDAGHGGEDGGAVGVNGLIEKECNLAICEILRNLFESSGVRVIMTRSDDRLLYTDYVKGTLKTQDLRNRLEVARSNENACFISIHMNKFSDGKYAGLQVYYSPNHEASQRIASAIQTCVTELLQPDNTRKIKKADSSIYLLDRIQSPAVMVECGFLSNEAEAAKLADEDYRKELAMMIYSAVMEQIQSAA